MAHKLAILLGEAEDKFDETIEKLELATGHPSHDIKLMSQIARQARDAVAGLGLDPDDTTAKELYHVLRARYARDSAQFNSDFDLTADHESQARLANLVSGALADHQIWSLTNTSVKALLKQLPPIKTKKLLDYRSLDSMLKRADTVFVVALARQLESATWQAKWEKSLAKLPTSSRQRGHIKIVMTSDHDLDNASSAVEVGAILMPLNEEFNPVQSLGQVLQIFRQAQVMIGQDLSRELSQLHASLRFWSQNLHLSAWLDDRPISFNIFDLADDDNHQSSFVDRSYRQAGQTIWQKLNQGYAELKAELQPYEIDKSKQFEPLPALVEAEVEGV